MTSLRTRFLREESGATAIEYGLIALLVSVGIIAALTATGTSVKGLFEAVTTSVTGL